LPAPNTPRKYRSWHWRGSCGFLQGKPHPRISLALRVRKSGVRSGPNEQTCVTQARGKGRRRSSQEGHGKSAAPDEQMAWKGFGSSTPSSLSRPNNCWVPHTPGFPVKCDRDRENCNTLRSVHSILDLPQASQPLDWDDKSWGGAFVSSGHGEVNRGLGGWGDGDWFDSSFPTINQ